MKMMRANIVLFVLAMLLFAACYFFGEKSFEYDRNLERLKQEELSKDREPSFGVSDGPPPDANYWDIAQWSCLVFGSSAVVAGIWLTKTGK